MCGFGSALVSMSKPNAARGPFSFSIRPGLLHKSMDSTQIDDPSGKSSTFKSSSASSIRCEEARVQSGSK